MNATSKTQVVKDFKEKSILVSREFNAPLENVWRAYTEKELLDQWWGPSPWHVETKHMNFSVGGHWLYAMVSPDGNKHWARVNYTAIEPKTSYALEDGFCDEHGNMNTAMPMTKGQNVFTKTETGTRVDFKLIYSSEADLQKVVAMGMEQGITLCMDQLEVLLGKQH
jgi:uncharacterized protein YndB with AHSA1/START domain